MIRRDFIQRKISLIQDDLAKLATFAAYTFDEVSSNFIRQAAVERMLERIITRAIDVNQHVIAAQADVQSSPPKDYRETFLALAVIGIYPREFAEEIAKSIGTRNVLVHEYDKTDTALIYGSIKDCLRDYQKYIDYLLAFLEKQAGPR